MKQGIFTKLLFAFLFFVPQLAFAQIQDNAINDVGDIAFVAYATRATSGLPGFAFVFLDNCPNGTSIGFTDDSWTGSAFEAFEGELTWTNNTGGTIAKGTVIKISGTNTASNLLATPQTNIGSVGFTGTAIGTANGDQLFAMTGNRTTPGILLAFVGGIINNSLSLNGTPFGSGTGGGPATSPPGTVVVNTNSYAVNIETGSKYRGSTVCSGTAKACNDMINTASSWGTAATTTPSTTALTGLTTPAAFYAATPNTFGGSVLPVELVHFAANTEGSKTNLTWATASETNNKGFDIERSYDGTNFSTIGTVKAQGKAGTYTFVDAQPFNGINYYRLKQVDFDGTETLSKVVTTSTTAKGNSKIKIFPSHTEGSLSIESGALAIEHIQVFNNVGQLVLTSGATSRLDLSALPSGLYLVQVKAGGVVATEKVFKR